MSMIIYFTPMALPIFEPYIDVNNYYFKGEEILVPPCTIVICIPCQNMEPDHDHNTYNCKLLTYHRGWDNVEDNDFITVYVLDNESSHHTLCLESGELLSTFLTYNQEIYGASHQKCVMGVNPQWPMMENHDDDEVDDGYNSV